MDPGNLSTTQVIQLTILLVYFLGLLGIGYLTMRLDASMEEYLLADRGLGAWLAGISSAASSESGWVTLGAVGMGYALGSSAAWFIPGCLLGYCVNWYLVAPRLRKISRERSLITLPDFLEDRVNDHTRLIRTVSVLILFVAMTAYVGAQFKASGKLFASLFFDDQQFGRTIGILVGAGFTIVYTMCGGFRASSWTDLIQGLIIAAGLSVFPIYLLVQMGGITEFTTALEQQSAHGWMEYRVTYITKRGATIQKTGRIDSHQEQQYILTGPSSVAVSGTGGSEDRGQIRGNKTHRYVVKVQSNTDERQRSGTEFSYTLILPSDLNHFSSFTENEVPSLPLSSSAIDREETDRSIYLDENRAYVMNGRLKITPTSVDSFNAGEDLVDPFGATNNPGKGRDTTQGNEPLLPISASLGFVLGLLGIGLGYPGMPHVLSRFMATRDHTRIAQARVIALFWGSIAFYGAVVIGMLARIQLSPGMVQDQEIAFPVLATELLNPVFSGILVSAILAAIMSTADSMMIVASSAVSRDLYQQLIQPDSDQSWLVLISRGTVVLLGLLGIVAALLNVQLIFWFVLVAWAILGASFGPAVLLGLWWPGLSRWGVLAGMITGAVTAIVWKQIPTISAALFGYSMYELIPAFALALVVTWGVSLWTERPDDVTERMCR